MVQHQWSHKVLKIGKTLVSHRVIPFIGDDILLQDFYYVYMIIWVIHISNLKQKWFKRKIHLLCIISFNGFQKYYLENSNFLLYFFFVGYIKKTLLKSFHKYNNHDGKLFTSWEIGYEINKEPINSMMNPRPFFKIPL